MTLNIRFDNNELTEKEIASIVRKVANDIGAGKYPETLKTTNCNVTIEYK